VAAAMRPFAVSTAATALSADLLHSCIDLAHGNVRDRRRSTQHLGLYERHALSSQVRDDAEHVDLARLLRLVQQHVNGHERPGPTHSGAAVNQQRTAGSGAVQRAHLQQQHQRLNVHVEPLCAGLQRGVAAASLGVSTKLIYVEPG